MTCIFAVLWRIVRQPLDGKEPSLDPQHATLFLYPLFERVLGYRRDIDQEAAEVDPSSRRGLFNVIVSATKGSGDNQDHDRTVQCPAEQYYLGK
jgi:hypothetical protein